MSKGYISEQMGSSRILSHGKITALPFKLASETPFSIFIVPAVYPDAPVIVNCQLSQDDAAGPCPFLVNQWCEPAIVLIPAEAINLATNDVYWGAGAYVSES